MWWWLYYPLAYRPVSIVGTFDHSREHYIGPRSLLSGGQEQESRGLSSNPEGIGWHVVTPFKITEGSLKGQEILVNRGWVAQSKLRPETRPQGQVEGEVNISGIVRKTEGRAQFAPKVRFFYVFSSVLHTLLSLIQVMGLLIKTHCSFSQILLFQPGLWVKSLPCLQFHPGLKPSLVTSK